MERDSRRNRDPNRRILLKGGTIDLVTRDVLIQGKKIAAVGPNILGFNTNGCGILPSGLKDCAEAYATPSGGPTHQVR